MRLFLAAGFLAIASVPVAPAAAPPVDFDRDVKPIFAKHCGSCHGAEKQKGGLRLDRRADALESLSPGKPADSAVLKRVTSADADERMPPKGDPLTPAQIATLRAWIEQGAKWPDDAAAANPADWWSLKPLVKPKFDEKLNPIDHFVRAKLKEQRLAPSPEASKLTLIRRVTFDLTGLPPTPAEIDAYLADRSENAYEKLVDRLLASPRYGERWARHWLDVVHFGETHGYDKDKPRPNAWPYRDYVIRSLNDDKPYGRFVQEQIAGDVLFPGTVDGIEALGFLAAGPWDFIGHAELPENKIDGKVARHLDRDDFVSNTIGTFMSLTAHCAQCHNHKFDPITQEDYYRLQAVFAAIDRTDKAYDTDPLIAKKRAEYGQRMKQAADAIAKLEAGAKQKAGKELVELDRRIAEANKAGGAIRPEYGYHSAIETNQEKAKWVQVDLGASVKIDAIVLRACNDDFNMIGPGFGFPVRFKVELSDDPRFEKGVMLVHDATSKDHANPGTAPVKLPRIGAAGRYVRITTTKLAPRQNDYIFALAELEVLDAAGANLAAGKPVTALDSIEAPSRWRKSNLTDGIFAPGPKASPEELAKLRTQREELLAHSLTESERTALRTANSDRAFAEKTLKELPASRRTAYIGAVHTGEGNFVGTGNQGGRPRPIRLLLRGDVTKPSREVPPGAIAGIPGINGRFDLPPNHTEADRRAMLAKWIADPGNPLTWRSIVNRVWQHHFGRGLVDTPNDFGKMGQLPTHPELLDWLAADFRDGGQSLKKLHRVILTSATYKQTSNADFGVRNAESKTSLFGVRVPSSAFRNPHSVDADNRFLWRQNRRKLEAEAVRDSILFASGKLDFTMGGPSFQDFVVEKPEHSPHYQYHLHDPEDVKAHRRAVYRFTVRSKQQPFMAALDCADPSLAVEKRNQTITPQQALALLNNRLAVAMAKHFAERVEKLAADDAGRVSAAFRSALGREPTEKERDALAAHAKEHGLANTCRVILNLNEFVFVD